MQFQTKLTPHLARYKRDKLMFLVPNLVFSQTITPSFSSHVPPVSSQHLASPPAIPVPNVHTSSRAPQQGPLKTPRIAHNRALQQKCPPCPPTSSARRRAGKRVLVAGAGAGAGPALCRALRRRGAHVTLIGDNEAALRAALAEPRSAAAAGRPTFRGGSEAFITCDLSDGEVRAAGPPPPPPRAQCIRTARESGKRCRSGRCLGGQGGGEGRRSGGGRFGDGGSAEGRRR